MNLVIAGFFENHSVDDMFPSIEDVVVIDAIIENNDDCGRN